MSCRFIGKTQFKIIQVSFTFYFNLIFLEYLFQPFHFFIIHGFVYDHDRIVDITTFDKVIVQATFPIHVKNKKCGRERHYL